MKNLIFIHGSGNEGSIWSDVVKYMDKNFNIFTPSLPGHGDTEGLYKNIDEYAQWVIKYIEELDLSDVVLIGHSMGGAVAVKSARNSRVSSLIVVGSGLKLPVSPKILNGLRDNLEETVKMIAKWSFSKTAKEELKEKAVRMMLKNKDIILTDFEVCNTYSGYEDAKDITKPSLVVVGDCDVMTPIVLAEEAAAYLKSNVAKVEKSGHMAQLENPNMLSNIIENFVNSL